MTNPDPEDEAFEELALKQGHWQHTSGWRKKQIQEPSMTQEVLKLAIQLKDSASGYWTENEIPIIEKLIRLLAQPEQEPVAWINAEKRTFEWNGPVLWNTPTVAVLNKIPLYTHPPQRTEQNFCPRCGKRTPDLTHIHTCTPPQD